MRLKKTLIATSLLAGAMLLVPTASQAHTTMSIVGQQLVPGGWINGYGVTDNQRLNEGPAIDGFIQFNNYDPVEYRLTARCVETSCNRHSFTVTVPALGSRVHCDDEMPLGLYEITEATHATMQASFRVVTNLPCAH